MATKKNSRNRLKREDSQRSEIDRSKIDRDALEVAREIQKRENGKMPVSFYYDQEMCRRYGKNTSKNKDVPCF